ncbi:MAG: ribonuclease HII [Treponema sp.]|nr:ribonuclease HII [Treponema sp.]
MDSKPLILTVGFDEAGRGPLAGPVCASAVILPPDFPVEILNDSKKLSEKKRLSAEEVIKRDAMWGIALVDHKTIDEINILEASMLAMRLAWEDLEKRFSVGSMSFELRSLSLSKGPQSITGITDGTRCPDVPIECRCEPKADGKYPCVMAASILAKTCRDRFMLEMDKKYPEYGYARHKGYPTPEHKKICRQLGPSPIQRLSFKY